jgi:hypothetical protein
MKKPKLGGGGQAHPALATAALAAITLALLLSGCGDSKRDPATQPSSSGPQIVSADSLRATAAEGSAPIYWAGEQEGTELELSRPNKDRTYVRYLTGDAKAGDRRAGFLTVSTYVQPQAVTALRRQGEEPGGEIERAPGNATVYFDRTNPGSVYLAYPGKPIEVEVYDPNFKRALRLVSAGQIVAVGRTD